MAIKFMIVGTQRTGTTWIRTTISSHPSVDAFGEVFLYSHGRLPIIRTAGHDVAENYGAYIANSPLRRIMHFTRRRAVVEKYLDHLYSRTDAKAIGFKLMRTQARQFPTVIQYANAHHVKIVHVVRENVLKTYISRETARVRKVAHSMQRVPVQQITISTETLIRKLNQIASDNFFWETLFPADRYMKLIYEEFVDNKVEQLDRLFKFLSVMPDLHVSSALVKLNPHAISDIVTNFSEVSRCLQGTPYEWCLEK